MSVAAAALALTSCSNDAAEEVILKGERKPLKVNATIDRTRTSLAADHVNLEWSEGDEIYLYIGDKLAKADVIKHTIGDAITATYNEGDVVYANYSLKNSYSKGAAEAEIDIEGGQTQSAPDVFAGENLPMVATGKIQNGTVNLAFKPVGHVLVFNVYGQAYNKDEKIKSITLETKEANNGYKYCDLTADALGYEAHTGNTSAAVTLTTPADIAAAMPTPDTKLGNGNQVYLVVAPVAYTAATITVKTTIDPTATDNIYNTYTFTTANGIDCSQGTARVVNLDLAKAAVQPAIEVPTIPQLSSDKADGLVIENIVFKNIATAGLNPADIVGVYSDADLTAPLENSWLTITENGELFASGKLYYNVAANDTAEDRTAYIGIKCAGVQAVIAITQVAQGASTDKYFVKVTKSSDDLTGEYLIVYEKSDTEAYVWNLTDDSGNFITADISNLGILSNAETTNNYIVSISKSGNGYLLCATAGVYDGKYIYHTGAKSNKIYFGIQSEAEKYLNTISIKNDGSADIVSSERLIRYLNSNSAERIRYYKTTSGGKSVHLYKLQE